MSSSKALTFIERFRDRLAYQDSMPQLVLLGIVSGLVAAAFIVVFRLAVEWPLGQLFVDAEEGFEALPAHWRFGVPLLGALLLGIMLSFVPRADQRVGVTHVLDRLHHHQGKLPARNIAVQFLAGVIALLSGQSVGREGPGIHLGAGTASLLGQWLKLPNNSLRTLVACGAAAAIAASFNTPMAGVVFAMEVILMEYTITGFIPIIIAAVLGAMLSQLVFGMEINFESVTVEGNLVDDMPFMVVSGLVISLAAVSFIRIHQACLRLQNQPILLRFAAIGLLTGSVAVFVPQIMATGYDTLDLAIAGDLDVSLLLLIVWAKLTVTAISIGLGMPGGLIGPTLVIGGCLGGLLGILGNYLAPSASAPELYVLLGMVAMLGSVLNAPLAALVAILELSHSPGLIFPGMLIVVVACLGVQLAFRHQGIFAEHFRRSGHDLYAEPGKGFLSRIGVRSVMNRSLRLCDAELTEEEAAHLVASDSLWLVIEEESGYRLLATANLARHLEESAGGDEAAGPDPEGDAEQSRQHAVGTGESAASGAREEGQAMARASHIDLAAVRAPQIDLAMIDSLATLQEASAQMRESGAQALLVLESILYPEPRVVGVLTRETLMNYYGM